MAVIKTQSPFNTGTQYFKSIIKYENLLFIPILKWFHGRFCSNISKPCKEMDENSTLFWLFLLLNMHGDDCVHNKIKIITQFFSLISIQINNI